MTRKNSGYCDNGSAQKRIIKIIFFPRKYNVLDVFFSALQDNLYEDVGVFLAMSIVHGGPCPKFFAKWLYEAIVSGLQTVEPTVEMVTDTELKSNINQVSFTSFLI